MEGRGTNCRGLIELGAVDSLGALVVGTRVVDVRSMVLRCGIEVPESCSIELRCGIVCMSV